MHDLTDWLRLYVLVASVLIAVIGTLQWRRWHDFKVENRLAWLALVALNFAIGFGTAEVLWTDQPGGFRNYVTALAMTFLLAAVLYRPVTVLRGRVRRTKESHS